MGNPANRCLKYCVLTIWLFLCWSVSANVAAQCSKKDHALAASWHHSYQPEAAQAFARRVQQLVREKNMTGFLALIPKPLVSGPRKADMRQHQFDEVFSDVWQRKVLSSVAPCAPVGWRGFSLAQGLIWFRFDQGKWLIFSINGANNLSSLPKLSAAWRINGHVVSPGCFFRTWLSSDNLKAFAKAYQIKNYRDFQNHPGQYIGLKIPLDARIQFLAEDSVIWLSAPMAECQQGALWHGKFSAPKQTKIRLTANGMQSQRCTSVGQCEVLAYRRIAKLTTAHCQALAPHIKGLCQQAFLVAIGTDTGGSMGWNTSYNLYGLFNTPKQGQFLVLLKQFFVKNKAINFLKTLN